MRLLAPALIAGALVAGAIGSVVTTSQALAAARQADAARSTILPGQWEYSYRIGPIPAGKEDRCLKQADVDQFSRGICTRKYTCDYTTRVVQDGKLALKGAWTDKKGRVAPVDANGTYTPESFRLNVKMRTIHGVPLAGVMEAKRVAATCKG